MKMKFKWALPVIIIIIFILLLMGCNADRDQTVSALMEAAQNTSADSAKMSSPQPNYKFLVNGTLDKDAVMASYRQNQLDTVQSMAQLYIDAISNGIDLANGEDAIEMFDLLFNRQTLAIRNLGTDGNIQDSFQCEIVGSGPNGERIVPLFITFHQDDPQFFCPLSRYGKQSRRAVEIYINYLLEGDAAKLSQWLSIDGGSDYYLEEANRLIEHYRQYDLSKTEIVNFDYDFNLSRFIYRIHDANKKEFEVHMVYGDGLTMPYFNSVLD